MCLLFVVVVLVLVVLVDPVALPDWLTSQETEYSVSSRENRTQTCLSPFRDGC